VLLPGQCIAQLWTLIFLYQLVMDRSKVFSGELIHGFSGGNRYITALTDRFGVHYLSGCPQ